jgi:uncharacterized protein YuzE
MQIIYDPRYNIAYLKILEKTTEVETLKISDELNIDMAPDGTVYGMELLNANQQLKTLDQGNLILINEALGAQQKISLETLNPV